MGLASQFAGRPTVLVMKEVMTSAELHVHLLSDVPIKVSTARCTSSSSSSCIVYFWITSGRTIVKHKHEGNYMQAPGPDLNPPCTCFSITHASSIWFKATKTV